MSKFTEKESPMNVLPFFFMLIFTALSCTLVKLFTNTLPLKTALCAQYFFSSLFIFLFWAVVDRTHISPQVFCAVGLGLASLNYLGAYCLWEAYKINVSRTTLFFPWISVVTIVLCWIFLNEYKNLNPVVIVGVSLHLVAIWLFRAGQKSKNKSEKSQDNLKKWLFFTLVLVATNAVVNFLMKRVSSDVPKTQFLFAWYSGSFFFSLPALFFEKEKADPQKRKFYFFIPILSLIILVNLASLYWAYQLNPGSTVISFHALINTFTPAVIGWCIFGERKGVSKAELWGFVCGIAAALLIIAAH